MPLCSQTSVCLIHFSLFFFFSWDLLSANVLWNLHGGISQDSLILTTDTKEGRSIALKYHFPSLDLRALHKTRQVFLSPPSEEMMPRLAQQLTHCLLSPPLPQGGLGSADCVTPTNKFKRRDSPSPALSHLLLLRVHFPSSGFKAKHSERPHNWFRPRKDTPKLGLPPHPSGREGGFLQAIRY